MASKLKIQVQNTVAIRQCICHFFYPKLLH
jgi:hypothetical protein